MWDRVAVVTTALAIASNGSSGLCQAPAPSRGDGRCFSSLFPRLILRPHPRWLWAGLLTRLPSNVQGGGDFMVL